MHEWRELEHKLKRAHQEKLREEARQDVRSGDQGKFARFLDDDQNVDARYAQNGVPLLGQKLHHQHKRATASTRRSHQVDGPSSVAQLPQGWFEGRVAMTGAEWRRVLGASIKLANKITAQRVEKTGLAQVSMSVLCIYAFFMLLVLVGKRFLRAIIILVIVIRVYVLLPGYVCGLHSCVSR